MLEIYGKSDRGNVRENNEDRICYPRPNTTSPAPPVEAGQLLLVADGVGGVAGGEHASRLTAETVKRAYYYGDHAQDPRWLLRRAIETANQEVLTYTSAMVGLRGAASTVTAAVVKGNQLIVANVGDSRTYVIRANGQREQISIDHSLTQQKINQRLLDPTQAKSDIDSHVITRSVGLEPGVMVDIFPPATVQPPYIPLAPGDAVLLCSDGLTDLVTDEEIARIVAANSPKKAVDQLIKLAKRNGGHDNISVIVGRMPGKAALAALAGQPRAFSAILTNSRLWLLLVVLMLVVAIALTLRFFAVDRMFLAGPLTQPTPQAAVLPTAMITSTTLAASPTSQAVAAALTVSPTASQSALMTPTVTRVSNQAATSASPTRTPAPGATATRVNAPTGTPTPAPAANPVAAAPPELVAPEAGYTIIGNAETTFAWKWASRLGPNQGFEILLWPLGQPNDKRGIHNAGETQTLTPNLDDIYQLSKTVTNRGEGNYEWTVAIVQLNPYRIIVEAPSRSIKISSPNNNSAPDPGAAGTRP